MTPPYSPHLAAGLHGQGFIYRLALGKQRELQHQDIHQSRSNSSNSSASGTSTPLLKYGPLAYHRDTNTRLPMYASRTVNPTPLLGSTSFHAFRDRLIQQQWQFDQHQQWRTHHESPGLGDFRRLSSELRRQIYTACFPHECTDIELVEVSQRPLRNGLVSLMRSNRSIQYEIRPLLEQHTKSRLFNLVLSKRGARFERTQSTVAFLTYEGLHKMTSETILPLDVFSRTRKSIRSLRLSIQIEPKVIPPAGLISVLEPFSMWIFSLLATAEALQFLLVEFHLSPELNTTEFDHDDGSETNVGELIGVLIGSKAALHCQRVMNVPLAAELQAVRFVVLQKDRNLSQPEKKITSFRWDRPGGHQPSGPQHVPQVLPQVVQQNLPEDVPQELPQVVSQQSLGQMAREIITQSVRRASQSKHQQQSSEFAHRPLSQAVSRSASQHALYHGQDPQMPASKPAAPPTAIRAKAKPADDQREIASPNEEPNPTRQADMLVGSPDPLQTEQGSTAVFSRSMVVGQELLKSAGHSTSPLVPDPDPVRSHLKRRHEQEMMPESHKRQKRLSEDHTATIRAAASPILALTTLQPPIPSEQIAEQGDQKVITVRTDVAVRNEEYEVESLRGARTKKGIPQIRVKWHGYKQLTWEPRASLMEDVPQMVLIFEKEQVRAQQMLSKGTKGAEKKAAKESTAEHTLQSMPQSGTGVDIPAQNRSNMIDIPQAATLRWKQWDAQYGQSQPAEKSIHHQIQQPQPPKQPTTAYFLYMQANRPGVYQELCKTTGNPELVTQSSITEEGTRRWRTLGEEERGAWDRMYAKRVAIYHIQMEAYNVGKRIPLQDEARALVEKRNKQTSFVDLA